jgi:hypothetical protein
MYCYIYRLNTYQQDLKRSSTDDLSEGGKRHLQRVGGGEGHSKPRRQLRHAEHNIYFSVGVARHE